MKSNQRKDKFGRTAGSAVITQGVLIAVILLLDYFTKSAVRNRDEFGRGITIIPDLLRFVYVKNEGAAFSILSGYRIGLIGVSALAIVIAAFILCRMYKGNQTVMFGIAMVIAGGLGNLIDRVVFGFVTDMISFSFFPPVFNVADIAVTVGCMILIIHIIFFDLPKGNTVDNGQGKKEKQR